MFKTLLSCLEKNKSLDLKYVYFHADRYGVSRFPSKGKTSLWPLNLHSIDYKLGERNNDSLPRMLPCGKRQGKTLWDNRHGQSKQFPKIETSQCSSHCKELLNGTGNLLVPQFRSRCPMEISVSHLMLQSHKAISGRKNSRNVKLSYAHKISRNKILHKTLNPPLQWCEGHNCIIDEVTVGEYKKNLSVIFVTLIQYILEMLAYVNIC